MGSDFSIRVATVRCEPSGREARVVVGSTLMDAIQQVSLPLGQGCEGVALCGFCHILVMAGAGSLSSAGAEERRMLASQHGEPNRRLACCARVEGDVTVTADYWNGD